jgi:uncharacterized protein (DUF58 family)
MGAFKVGLLTAILFAVAVVNDWSIPDRLIVTLLVVLGIAWIWSRLSLKRLGLTRSLSVDRVRAGEWITEEFTLYNHSRLPKLWVEVRDLSSLPGYAAGQVVSVGSRGAATWSATGRCHRRGRFRLGPITFTSGDPLGLFRSRTLVPATHELVVYPPKIDVSDVPLPMANMTGGRTTNAHGFIATHTAAGIREFTQGDPFNRISWSATARLGRMMVKEFDPDPSSDIWILLDLNGFGPDHDPVMPASREWAAATIDETLEYAIAVAGSLAERALDSGRRVGLIVNRAMPIRIEADGSQRQWFRIFETLAIASAFGQRRLVEAIQADSRKFSRNSGLIVITSEPSRDWVRAAHSLVMRQVPVSAVLVADRLALEDPEMEQLKGDLVSAHVHVAEMVPGERLAAVDTRYQVVA